MRSMKNLPNNESAAVSALIIAAVAIVAIAAVAGGAYFLLTSNDGKDNGGPSDGGDRELIQGSLGLGTYFEFGQVPGGKNSIISSKATIVAQNKDHYVVEVQTQVTGGGSNYTGSIWIMMHKENGSIMYAKDKGEANHSDARMWEASAGNLAHGCWIFTIGAVDGNPTIHEIRYIYASEYDAVGKLTKTQIVEPKRYTPSSKLGTKLEYNTSGVEGGTPYQGKTTIIVVAEDGPTAESSLFFPNHTLSGLFIRIEGIPDYYGASVLPYEIMFDYSADAKVTKETVTIKTKVHGSVEVNKYTIERSWYGQTVIIRYMYEDGTTRLLYAEELHLLDSFGNEYALHKLELISIK